MQYYAPSFLRAIEELNKLPGIGPKSAEKLTSFLLKMELESFHQFIEAMEQMREKVKRCKKCFHLTETDLCSICQDPLRQQHQICIVEESRDLISIEKTGVYRGLYHVLQGVLRPVDGINAEKIRIRELLERVRKEPVQEIIMATNLTYDGELTALYLARELKMSGVHITRIASGLPMGSDLEFADQLTIKSAFKGRESMETEDEK
jgi:recombination protein RecR